MEQPSKHLLLLVLLAPALLTHAAEAEATKTVSLFTDWLSQNKAVKTGLASYYEEVEISDVCMRETSAKGCGCYGRRGHNQCCYSYSVDTEMTCCSKPYDKPYKGVDNMFDKIVETGKCTYTQSYLEKPVEYNEDDDTVLKVGTFTGSCALNKDSGTCGEPSCEGTTLTIQGDILKATKVAFLGFPGSLKRSEDCAAILTGDCKDTDATKKASIMGVGATPVPFKAFKQGDTYYGGDGHYYPKEDDYKKGEYEKKEEHYHREEEEKHYHREEERYPYHRDEEYYKKEGDEEKYYKKEEEKKYHSGSALVFMGTFYTVSRVHDLKYHDTGIYQSVQVLEFDTSKAMAEAPPGAYLAKPNEVYFRFVKGKEAAKEAAKA